MKENFDKSSNGISRRDFIGISAQVLAIAGTGLAASDLALAQTEPAQTGQKGQATPPSQDTITLDRQEGACC
jgi:hypothetical protein